MDEEEYLPLSWLSQATYCLRRAALLLNERLWMENADTAKGRDEHRRAHERRIERRGDQLKLFEYDVYSEQLRIWGKCDCVEAQRCEPGCRIPAADFPVCLYPVEYKHGSVREEPEYNIQLCAQAMCLEEMYHTHIPSGAIFFITAHRRLEVAFTPELRAETKTAANALWEIRRTLKVPAAEYGRKCQRCSLKDLCMPKTASSAKAYCQTLAREAQEVEAL
ncbi:MAG TPA: CRISPR-associated protein Cas4 [Candidatus Ornithocaccomicrobium faecavium]|uniref:CRISPR-associated exonuclease Cas4 n=1 Tax=Candidatus Ornithocaccomicrobium faecavium TaxID=2840890 RepID=A0A9D1P510_9FIRM|nr:CRISPR-associated protein Cas4 [Candidatus Ornithocaccomicrobium faecavium]